MEKFTNKASVKNTIPVLHMLCFAQVAYFIGMSDQIDSRVLCVGWLKALSQWQASWLLWLQIS